MVLEAGQDPQMKMRADKSGTHYKLESWADFVHGLVEASQRPAMEQHLAGCTRCARQVRFLAKLVRVAAAEAKLEVPDYAFRQAKAIFALQQPEKVHILPRILAKLVYDSFREPLPAGIRSAHRISRQAMYEAGDYCVDLRMEHEHGSSSVLLVGQVANRKDPGRSMANVPVVLMSGKSLLVRTTSNEFGEFQMEYEPAKHLKLLVPVREQAKGIEVRLNGLIADDGEGGER